MSDRTYIVDGRNMPAHPAADCFPLMEGRELEALAADIKANGQIMPCVYIEQDGKKVLIDGRNRAMACITIGRQSVGEMADTSPNSPSMVDAIVSLNLSRRHLSESQRQMVAARIANMRQGERTDLSSIELKSVSQPEAAAKLNTSVAGLKRAKTVIDHGDDELISKVDRGRMSVTAAANKVSQERKRAAAAESKTAVTHRLYACPVSEAAQHVETLSVDAIVTDPPYGAKFVEKGIYRDLGAFAGHALRPGGVLMVMCGHAHLPRITAEILECEWLQWRWIVAYHLPMSRQNLPGPHVGIKWKPITVFRKPGPAPGFNSLDFFTAPRIEDGEKAAHKWGQTVSGMAEILDAWCRPGWTVCDPFCGGGSTLVAAKNLGMGVIGSDIDPVNVVLTQEALDAKQG